MDFSLFYGCKVIVLSPEVLFATPLSCSVLKFMYISTCFSPFILLWFVKTQISCLCYWGLELKNYPVLGVKRKLRKRSLTEGKYFGCSSYYLSLGPMSSWSNMSTFIKCFSGASMAKTGVGKWFKLHWGHLDHRLLQLELLRRVSPLLEILLHVNSWTLYIKPFYLFLY